MTTHYTADDLPLEAPVTLVDAWLAEHCPPDADVVLWRLWALGWMAVSARNTFRSAVGVAHDNLGYSHQTVADALGVSRQNISKMLLRARDSMAVRTPPKQRERLPFPD